MLAVAVRLAGTLRGGGLWGLGNYDDGVHFAAALGLVNGLFPYADFLLLHPPGVALLLAPFAALSWLIGEPDAVAAARLSWMVLGGVNTVLCALVLRPFGRLVGLVAALWYALSIGAVYVEHTLLLEPPATTVLLLALLLTRLLGSGEGITPRRYVVAGLLLGLSPAIKIWGVVAVAVVVITILLRRGRRPALITTVGAAVSCTAVCLPFFLHAPSQMFRMVVLAQLGRRRANERMADRLEDVLGLREWTGGTGWWNGWLVLLVVIVLAATIICLTRPELRVVAALTITHLALVLTTPMWFLHYAGLTAAPLALTLGGALAVTRGWARGIHRWLPAALAGAGITGTLVLAYPMLHVDLGDRRLPTAELGPALVDAPGCIATDWPMTLLQLDLMQRNLDRECRFVIDLGGYSYYLLESPDHPLARADNRDWQALALNYYRSGSVVIPVRFEAGRGFSESTAQTLDSWPVVAEADGYVIRRPRPAGG